MSEHSHVRKDPLIASVFAISLEAMADTDPDRIRSDPTPRARRRKPDLEPEIPVEVLSKTSPRGPGNPLGEGVDTMTVTRFEDGTTFIEVFDGISDKPLTCIRHGQMGPYEIVPSGPLVPR